ncbi:MAG: hypothetical protein WBQ09_15510 [Terriglobales bacterium]|jgi:hypothetical protein
MAYLPDDTFMQRVADAERLTASEHTPARLKARIYSALMKLETEEGPLMSLRENKTQGRKLCIFEDLVQIAPVGQRAKSLNLCRACHARVMAEQIENAPIYWSGCPYVSFKNS